MRLKEITEKDLINKIKGEATLVRNNVRGLEKMNFQQREKIYEGVVKAGIELVKRQIENHGLNHSSIEDFKCNCDLKEIYSEKGVDVVVANVEYSIQINKKGFTSIKDSVDTGMVLIEI
ncbi:hypothetical protein CACET_c27550 [Clostridium aceticum]|uniref:Uncharacterized protein n=1 Tax=Clostridium aceticum TaxID=84022 RepID=A0A0D8IBL3_9CLOT|nr:hypothetical protein [Clostridium aceticum]AKL96200.1 hypothetical protein CACET_c27550 [Clostridium aceticum]KJF26616.1 hypothetical protein TZ02_12135 [Clostridium aceticum]